MNWYFDNGGTADGPHDSPAMAAFVAEGRITALTLVWQTSMPQWQDAAVVAAPWFKGGSAPPAADPQAVADPESSGLPAPVSAPTRPPTESRRRPILAAPTGALTPPVPSAPTPAPKRGFFARLFGRH